MENKPRKPWVAGLLSLIQPGLGQVYNGEVRKALPIYIIPALLIPAMILCLHSGFIRIFLATYAILGFAYYTFVFVDAVRTARQFKTQYAPKKYNKLITYIGIYFLIAIFSMSISTAVKTNVIQAYKFPSGSMEPTLLIGDHILVDRTQSAKNPKRGDLIVFEYPEDSSKDFIKRVVAVGGDTVEIKDKELFVNGKTVKEPYAVHKETDLIPATINPRDNYGPQVVPKDSYFVLGDNRDRSYDSRFWGAVTKNKVKGTVKNLYWSWDKKNLLVRWDRIGMRIL
ncbi:signal peptidase I [Citrifermentans bremense]|nr:signal peptidase I [Citrifermentans bremense]